jgi:hypothetical protein
MRALRDRLPEEDQFEDAISPAETDLDVMLRELSESDNARRRVMEDVRERAGCPEVSIDMSRLDQHRFAEDGPPASAAAAPAFGSNAFARLDGNYEAAGYGETAAHSHDFAGFSGTRDADALEEARRLEAGGQLSPSELPGSMPQRREDDASQEEDRPPPGPPPRRPSQEF